MEVELRAVETGAGRSRFDIMVGPRSVGWLQLSGPPSLRRLSGEVFEPFRGRGIGTTAVAIACRIDHRTTGAQVLEAFVPSGFGAAHRVLEANGFTVADLRAEPLRFELTLTKRPDAAEG